MNRSLFSTSLALLLLLLVAVAGCDSTSSDDEFEVPEVTLAEDIPADPVTGFDPVTGQPVGANEYTFYSLREDEIVPRSDSASTEWDIALKATTILTNGGASGPGSGGAQVLEILFEEVTEAPASGYATDAADARAIPTGSGNGWYNYNPQNNNITPIPGRVIVVRCADGTYAKLRILSYYEGAPETPTSDDASRYYTFEYVHQPDGSRRFE
ncbi:MAG TPA: HmuY family protein [Rhodothermales bacterium]|nr:HmuY family protein [Rhodothermales bacterium]